RQVGPPLGCQSSEAVDRDGRILVKAEDILERDEALHERPGRARIEVGEELERVAKALAADPQAVVVARGGRVRDLLAALADRAESTLDQVRRDRARRPRERSTTARGTRAQRAREAVDERLVPARVERLEQRGARLVPLLLEQRAKGGQRVTVLRRRVRDPAVELLEL